MEFKDIIKKEETKQYYKDLMSFIEEEYRTKTIYPKYENIFNALNLTPFNNVKVVIIGQDPYHNPYQAQGLAFSVPNGMLMPPSLRNILLELNNDLGITKITSSLEGWAKQGVLLLNTILTVEENKPLSHQNKGWEIFTDELIKELNKDDSPKVFILWGAKAIAKSSMISNKNHLILTANHPSPLSAYRGFFGCKHFSKTNKFLIDNFLTPIDWSL